MDYCDQHTNCASNIQVLNNRLDTAEQQLQSIAADNKILHEMNANIRVLAVNTENLGKEVSGVKEDVKELKEKPIKRWDSFTSVVITTIIAGIIGYLLAKLIGG